jgi:hypothetical protein
MVIYVFLVQPSAIENGPYDYTRSGNPTRDALERFDMICWFMFCIAIVDMFC